MNWQRFLGDSLYMKMAEHLKDKKMTIATFVRIAIEQGLKEVERDVKRK